jgi:hypothetical protein
MLFQSGSLLILLGLLAGPQASGATKSDKLNLPLEFEANQGQFAPEVFFLARTSSHFVYLTREGMTLGISDSTTRGAALQMKLMGADASAAVTPESRLPGVSNYFIGNDQSRWQHAVPHYGRIRYRQEPILPSFDCDMLTPVVCALTQTTLS